MSTMKPEKMLGQIGYEAYSETRALAGHELKTWEELDIEVQNAWQVAARAIEYATIARDYGEEIE